MVQYDPLSPCGNNVDLVLQARVRGIHPADYRRWLYEERKGNEAFDKELCLMPVEDLSLCRGMVTKQSRQKKINDFIAEHKKEIGDLLGKIK
ncbi:MAG: hypothetical protein Q8N98_02460, partial [bacterium]|nr:hypothetical protein [bacterium]